MKKRALISVSDKTNIVEFSQKLNKLGWEIISTGGTLKILKDNGVDVIAVDNVTDFPEILNGRVKTLHPLIHGGLLSVRDNIEHQKQVKENNINYIDMVVVNLYPFKNTILKDDVKLEEAIENIDIGGPSMLRSAAKNYKFVTVVTDINDYDHVINELEAKGEVSLELKQKLAAKTFRETAFYDSLISNYLTNKFEENIYQDKLTIGLEKHEKMRYGENPHQESALYKSIKTKDTLIDAEVIQGKQLSYNNINDANAAINIVREFRNKVAIVGLKHANPCGLGQGSSIEEAWDNCYEGDSVSIFGGIVAANQKITKAVAEKMNKIFLEIIIAPDFEAEALEVFAKKSNLRIVKLNTKTDNNDKRHIFTTINGGMLVQDEDMKNVEDNTLEFVTNLKPSDQQLEDMKTAQKIVKHVKSNAIVIVKNNQLIAVGAGQMNRVSAAKIALEWCLDKAEGAVMGSDAFLPFPDVVELASTYKISAIIQPGGSIKDQDSIDVANEKEIVMAMTKMRHFKH